MTNISADWEVIGIALNISQNDLKGLRQENTNITVKLAQVINLWIESESLSPVSWKTLISAIEGPIVNKKKKAKEIRNRLYSQH